MNTIYLLKQIIDLIYEESKYTTKLSNDASSKLEGLERELEEKNKEVARLYTENIKLENIIRQFEADFELMANICGDTTPLRQKTNDVIDPSGVPISSTVPTTVPTTDSVNKKRNKPKMASKEDVKNDMETKREVDTKENDEPVESVETSDTDKPVKKDRRNYMREYQRAYRKKQREEKISMTV